MVGATRGDWVKVRGLDVPAYRDSLQALFSNYNTTRSDICTIEQVEILKGPASVRVPPAGSSITQIGFGMASAVVVWCVMLIAAAYGVLSRDEAACRQMLQSAFVSALAILVATHCGRFGVDAFNDVALLVNSLMVVPASGLVIRWWRTTPAIRPGDVPVGARE